MEYFLTIGSIIIFIENRIYEKIDYKELERATGFSIAHIRDIFVRRTGMPLSKYILTRKISNAAYEILYNHQSIIQIASKYGFSNHDTFTRAFKRITGLTPSRIQKKRPPVGRIKLCAGVFGIGLLNPTKERMVFVNKVIKQENSVVLYGISKVEYGPNGCTPYPMCLKSCANYLGQDVSLDFTMAATGAAFRLTWDTTSWNGGNVDVIHTFDNPEEVYRAGVEALGRDFQIITRTNTPCDVKFSSTNNSDKKSDFISFIKNQIDKGFPCIALGIIGPPEACIITGYRENGETLLGWNFFQGMTEFAADVNIDESGYFISDKWWENNDTIAVISLGEKDKPLISYKTIIENAVKVMTGRLYVNSDKTFAKGIMAYDAWKKAVLNETDFPSDAIFPILAERLMCQGDAMDCLIDGRRNAASFMKKLSEELKEQDKICKTIEEQFAKVASNVGKMAELLGGYERDEKQMRNFAKTDIRQQIAVLIDECKTADTIALENLRQLLASL